MGIKNYTEYYKHLTEFEKKFSPKELFFKGKFSFLNEGIRVSIVGSRNASPNGLKRAEIVTNYLISKNVTIVSGLAKGIDAIAHRTAVSNGGKTIAVLGTPLNNPYPKENYQLFTEIVENHLVVSQFPENYPFQRKNFPVRNKTMALISDATIIIEATENSGTRHQGWEALKLGRIVFLLENVVNDEKLTWPKKMLEYGAQVLRKEDLENLIYEIPSLTEKSDYAF
jgi:DNA processing protein